MNKKFQSVIERYALYAGRTLSDCYANPSQAKINAWDSIRQEMVATNGWGLTVLSYNSQFFTCAYLRKGIHKDSLLEYTELVYHTARHTVVMEL